MPNRLGYLLVTNTSHIVGVGRLVCQSYSSKPETGPQFDVALQPFDQTMILGPRAAEKQLIEILLSLLE